MLVFGRHSGVAEIDDAGTMHCPSCQKTTPARAMVFYRFFHLWWLCSVVTSCTYSLACTACHTVVPTTAEALEASGYSPKSAIPFLRRRGWLFFLALVVCLIGASVAFSRWTAYRVDRILADPKPGDLYMAELTAIDGTGFDHITVTRLGGPGYGGMKIIAADETMRIFATTMEVYNTKDAIRSYLGSDKVAYDLEGLVVLTADQVADLRDRKRIYGARRDEPLVFPDDDQSDEDESESR